MYDSHELLELARRREPPTSAAEPADPYASLLARAGDGDAGAFHRLYVRASPVLYRICLRILGRPELAEEARQEAFIKIWRHAGDYSPTIAKSMTWMGSIARHAALDILRARRRTQEVLPGADAHAVEPADPAPGPADDTRFRVEEQALTECWRTLGDEQREALHLAYYGDHTHAALAARLKRPLGTVKTWIRRGLATMRGCMERMERMVGVRARA